MTFVFRLIAGLGHGPQAKPVHQIFLIRAAGRGQNALKGCGRGLRGQGFQSRGGQRAEKAFQTFRVRLGMYAVKEGQPGFLKMPGNGLVGRDHELLDQPVRVVALAKADFLHAALGVKAVFGLGQIEIQAAARSAGRAQHGVELKSLGQHGQYFLVARIFLQFGQGPCILVKHAGFDLIIGEPRG